MHRNQFKLIITSIYISTDLVVELKSRTTKEEATKEVGRIQEALNVFDGYVWKIAGCANQCINELDDKLQEQIKKRINAEEEPEDCLFWDGRRAIFELEVYDVNVNSNIETFLKAQTKKDAILESKGFIKNNNLLFDYQWGINNCSESSIIELDSALQKEVIDRLNANLDSCIDSA